MDDDLTIQVHTYTRRDPETHEKRNVQIVCTRKLPLSAILRGFYQTAVINVITYNKAYALFPRNTYIKHKTYLLKEGNDYFGALLKKYRKRGWAARDILWPEEESSNKELSSAYRRIGDRYTWTIVFGDPIDIRTDNVPNFIEQSEFRIAKQKHKSHVARNYIIFAPMFFAHVLRHRYTYYASPGSFKEGHRDSFWLDFVGDRVDR